MGLYEHALYDNPFGCRVRREGDYCEKYIVVWLAENVVQEFADVINGVKSEQEAVEKNANNFNLEPMFKQ